MPNIEVRRAVSGDLDALREVLAFLHDGPPWSDDEGIRAREALERIVNDPRRALLLALVAGAPAGTIDVNVCTNLTRHVRPFAIIENVVVVPAARRQGVGRRLMAEALDFAQAQGCYKAQLVSANQRDAAHHLYAALGFDADVSGYRRYLIDID
jgi:GNAT superfamily N-acetyltransferase